MTKQSKDTWLDTGTYDDLETLEIPKVYYEPQSATSPPRKPSPTIRTVEQQDAEPARRRSALMTYADAAAELSISINSLRTLIDKGLLEGKRVGARSKRVRRADIMHIVKHGLPASK